MAEIVLAYCSSHAPMMSSARMAAPEEQRDNFFGALDRIKEEAVERGVQACVVLSNEHFTNFFLENFPQICIGLGEKNWGPTEEWLPIDKVWIPGHPGLANHIAEQHAADAGFDPAFSHLLELDHGIMTVYYELDNDMKLPLVPIVQNCAVPPLMPVRRCLRVRQGARRRDPFVHRAAAGGARRGRRAVALDRQPAGRRHRRGLRPLVPRAPRAR